MPYASWPFSGCLILFPRTFTWVTHKAKAWAADTFTIQGNWGWQWRGGRGVLKEPVGWAAMIWPSLGLGQSTSAWLLKLLMEAKSPGHSKSQLPSPALGEVKGGSPNAYNWTLKEFGHFRLLLDAGWFWFSKSWLQPSQKTEDLETKDKKMKLKRNMGPPSVPQSATKEGKKSTQACSLHQVTLLSDFKVQAHWSHVKNRSHQWARMCVQVCVCVCVCVYVCVPNFQGFDLPASVLTSLLHCISSSCLKPGYHMEEMVRNRTEAGTRTAHSETPEEICTIRKVIESHRGIFIYLFFNLFSFRAF